MSVRIVARQRSLSEGIREDGLGAALPMRQDIYLSYEHLRIRFK
ncbi:hypothetical protein RTCIAT899_PA00205 (plasmid) [Rhizobium tropici CIAT 899]|nr:hypothetical protein RTCIAT899_PA00205 [Rhizobium tropici CIAT 899]